MKKINLVLTGNVELIEPVACCSADMPYGVGVVVFCALAHALVKAGVLVSCAGVAQEGDAKVEVVADVRPTSDAC